MARMLFNIEGSTKNSLILEYALRAEGLSDQLVGCTMDRANEILIQYGAVLYECEHRGCGEDYEVVLHVKALTDKEYCDAVSNIEEYRSWLIATSGSNDTPCLPLYVTCRIRKEHPCPAKITPIARALERIDHTKFRSKLPELYSTEGYKLQLWDWKHSARYAHLFAEEDMPDLSAIPDETVRHYFSLP